MTALHKLKAYFGMVPTDEVDDYEDEVGYRDRYSADSEHYPSQDVDRGSWRRYSGGAYPGSSHSGGSYSGGYSSAGLRGGYRQGNDEQSEDYADEAAERSRPRRQWSSGTSTRGSYGIDAPREQVSRLRAVSDTGNHLNLSKITTLHPRSYSEARTIGEQYRDGTPVIMNLTEMEEADAKRLVDFAAGLAFALRGSIEKVTNRVFLLSPPNVDVAAEDKRRMAEGAFFNYG
jgi:cell division inhibitor SepF